MMGIATSPYDDATLAGTPNGTPIKKVHITQLRARARTGIGGSGGSGSSPLVLQWLVTDHLGTPRMIFDKTGSLANVKRNDYLPFGEELTNQGLRPSTPGYSASDNVRQKFTSYERDNETDLDYAQARYYASKQGRFTSVDPLMASATVGDPQTFNRYTYALNSPTNFTDPSGMLSLQSAPGQWGPGAESTLKEGFGGAFFGGSYSRNDEHRYETTWRHFQYDDGKGGEYSYHSYGTQTGRWVSGSRGSTLSGGAGLAWHQRGILGPIGDYSRGVANTVVPFGIIDRVHQSRGEPTPDSDAYRAGEGSGVVMGLVLPLPGGKTKAVIQATGKAREVGRALKLGERFVGKGYTEIAPGVFRSSSGLRHFRMTTADLVPTHGKLGPHVHFEFLNKAGEHIKNIHVPLIGR